MNARCINLRQQTGREQVGGFGFSNNFLDFSIERGGKRWKEKEDDLKKPTRMTEINQKNRVKHEGGRADGKVEDLHR